MRSLSPDPEIQGTLSLLLDMIITHPDASQEASGAGVCALVGAAQGCGFTDKYAVGEAREAQVRRKLTLAEVARLRAALRVALDAIEELPPHAIQAPTGLTVIRGGDA